MKAAVILELQHLRFNWPGGPAVLDIADLQIRAGETVFLHGPSGCGKSTLLSLLAGVLPPVSGQVRLLGQDWQALNAVARDRHRVDHLGYVFQQFNLLPWLGVVDNVLLPCRFSTRRMNAARGRTGSARAEAERWLADMGLEPALWDRPACTLSGGQQQRVAAARALIGEPALVIADEPTSALDEDRREAFLDRLLSACDQAGSGLVFVSHDRRMADRFERQLSLPAINRAATMAGAGP